MTLHSGADVYAKENWLQSVSQRLRSTRRVATPLSGISFDFFPNSEVLVKDLLETFLARRWDSSLVVRAYRDGKQVSNEALVIDDGCASVLRVCQANNVMINMSHLQKELPYVGEVAALISAHVCANVRIDAFISPASSAATPTHFDHDHSFVVQLLGVKQWRCYDAAREFSLTESGYHVDASNVGQEHFAGTLRPGDGLFVPAGTLHRAFTIESESIHLAVNIDPIHPSQVLGEFLSSVVQVEVDSVYPSDANELSVASDLYSMAQRALAEEPTKRFVEFHERRQLFAASRYLRMKPEPVIDLSNRSTVFRLAPGTLFRVTERDGKCCVEFSTHFRRAIDGKAWEYIPSTLMFPSQIEGAFQLLFSKPGSFTCLELDGLFDPPSTNVFIKTLVKAGLISEVI